MAEYIKREDAERALLERCKETGYGGLTPDDIRLVMRTPWRIPAADVVERKTGAWVETYGKYGNFRHQCSECGEMFGMPFDFEGKYYPYNYCPNCGADMRGEDDV